MFNLFLDGVYHSSHSSFAEACRNAREQSVRYHNAYCTVFDNSGEHTREADPGENTFCGLPDYIITPQTPLATGAIAVRTAASLLKMRLIPHTVSRLDNGWI